MKKKSTALDIIASIIYKTHFHYRPTLVSDVIGIAIQCGNEICHTSNISLAQPVVITFRHYSFLTVSSSIK